MGKASPSSLSYGRSIAFTSSSRASRAPSLAAPTGPARGEHALAVTQGGGLHHDGCPAGEDRRDQVLLVDLGVRPADLPPLASYHQPPL